MDLNDTGCPSLKSGIKATGPWFTGNFPYYHINETMTGYYDLLRLTLLSLMLIAAA